MGVARTAGQNRTLVDCAEGDERAWEELYRTHAPMVRSFLFRLGVDPEALEDATQDVFLETYRYLDSFRGDCSFKTWLYRICMSQARRVRRSKKKGRLLRSVIDIEGVADDVTAGELGDGRARRLVSAALAQLSEGERLVFVLYELEGVNGKGVAELAECPEATVWRRLHYARKKFSDYIEKNGGTG